MADEWDPTQYEFDPRPDELNPDRVPERIAVIRTSDRLTYRRCRRRWAWSSHLRQNLGPKQNPAPLWMGTGFHFAMEDFHGLNKFGHPAKAFDAFAKATYRHVKYDRNRLPADIDSLTILAKGMLSYYADTWLVARDPLQTYVHNGVPQLEVNFRVDVPFDAARFGYDKVVYSGTLDRVVVDENGLLWIVEYKTAKAIQVMHYAHDTQVSSYCWVGDQLYGRTVAGVIYQQHRKDTPNEPRILSNGRISTDKRQLITHQSLRQYILNIYGSVQKAPQDYVDFLNWKASQEDLSSDLFVRRDKIPRNQHQREAEGAKILMEIEEMLDPKLSLYPNPDRTCAFMCPFHGPCVSIDDGSDWQYELDITMQTREALYDGWRSKLVYPGDQPDEDDRDKFKGFSFFDI